MNEKIKKWKYHQDKNPKLFIKDTLDFINQKALKSINDEKRKVEYAKRKKSKTTTNKT